MDPEIRIEFHIIGENFSPEGFTKIINISPTRVWHVGDSVTKTKLLRKKNAWCFSKKVNKESLDINDYISPIVDELLPKRKIISSFCASQDLYLEISCVIYIINQTPILHLDPALLTKLHKLNVDVDFDIILTE